MQTRSVTTGASVPNDLPGRPGGSSRQDATRSLAWLWSAIFSISLLSFVALGAVWPSQALLFAGVLGTIALVRQAKARRPKLAPVPHLSGASKCVWQMDREA